MNHHPTAVRSMLALATALGVSLIARSAAAYADCAQDSDCTKGFSCQVVGSTGECTAVACTEAGCPPTECDAATLILGCVPAPCSRDSDCGSNMVCYAQIPTLCYPGPCPTTPVSACAYNYNVPCTVDSDCGIHFTCPASGWCEPDPIACSADSDCPSSWTCSGSSWIGGSCLGSSEGGVTCVAGPGQCEPPYFRGPAGGGSSPGEPLSLASDAGGTGTGVPVVASGDATGDVHEALKGGASCQVTGVGTSPVHASAPWALLVGLSALLRRSRSRRPAGDSHVA